MVAAMAATTTMATAKTTSLISLSLRRSSRMKSFSVNASSSCTGCSISSEEFDLKIPNKKALTPPSSCYSLSSFHSLELDRIFYKTWQIKNPGDYFTGRCLVTITQMGDIMSHMRVKASQVVLSLIPTLPQYGLWIDTNLILLLRPGKCRVVFDYFLEPSLKDDKDFMHGSLQESERVQMEDVALCEGVQRGLVSLAHSFGRYAPTVENAMHHCHLSECLEERWKPLLL